MYLILIEYLYFSNAFTGRNLLARSNSDKAKLSFYRSRHHQIIQSLVSTFIFFAFPFPIIANQLFTNHRNGRIMSQTFLLQGCVFLLIVILILSNLQLCLTLYSHLKFFPIKGYALFQSFQLVTVRQSLLLQVKALLLHLYLLFLIGNHLLLPFVTLVFNAAKQIRIGKDKNGISLLKQTSFLANDAFNASCFTGVDFNGQYRLNQSFYIYIFHKIILFDFRYLSILGVNTQFSGT